MGFPVAGCPLKARAGMQNVICRMLFAAMLAWFALSLWNLANAATADKANTPPRFEDFLVEPAGNVDQFASRISMASAQAKLYRTVISLEGQKEPNFAGHYRLITWGCGTDCRGFAIVDCKTGVARTIKGLEYVGGAMGNDQPRIDFRLDSRLLIVNGVISDNREGSLFYEWTGKGVKPLLRLPLLKEDFSGSSPEGK